MASDEETYHCDEDNLPKSKIGGLIIKLNKMLKKPELDFDLNNTLDSFLEELQEKQEYLSSGIVNVKFAEAGLFLQSSVALYSKKVDLLWDSTMQYQMKLCSYNKKKEGNAEESSKILERLNRNKRKKLVLQESNSNCGFSDSLTKVVESCINWVELCQSVSYYGEIQNRWRQENSNETINEFLDDDTDSQNSNNRTLGLSDSSTNVQELGELQKNFICQMYLPINHDIVDVTSGEKLGNYSDMYINRAVPYLQDINFDNTDVVNNNYSTDLYLLKFLKEKKITYKMLWEDQMGDDFKVFEEAQRQQNNSIFEEGTSLQNSENRISCRRDSFVKLTRLPDELMAEYVKEHSGQFRTLIQDILLKEKENLFANLIKKGSERISDADSQFHDGVFGDNDHDTTDSGGIPYLNQQSLADSGIFCSAESEISSGMFINEDQHFAVDAEVLSNEVQNKLSDSGFFSCEESLFDKEETNNQQPNEPTNNNECVETVEGEDVGKLNSQDQETTKLPPFLPIHTKSIIKPANETKLERVKRKLVQEENENDKPLKRRKKSFRWLKTTTAPLKQFEKFFLKHYEPESGEEGFLVMDDYSDDDDTDSVLSELVVPDMDESNEEFENTMLNSSVNATADTSKDTLVNSNLQMSEKDGMLGEESGFSSILRNREGDQEVPNSSEETEKNTDDDDDYEDTAECDNQVAPSAAMSQNPHYETENLQRLRAVNEWRRFIEPKLEEAQHSSTFDIHKYGTHIMDSIPPNENLSFKTLAQGKHSYEVARLFLASLQLANTYNVELISPVQGELANDTFELKLLTRERYHEHLDEYEAPSENSFREKLAQLQARRPSQPLHSTPGCSYTNSSQQRYSNVFKSKAKRQRLSFN